MEQERFGRNSRWPVRRQSAAAFAAVLVLAVVMAGCAGTAAPAAPAAQAPATQAPAAQAPAAQPTAAAAQATAMPTAAAVQATAMPTTESAAPQVLPATGATPSGAAAASAGALVNLAQKDNFGRFLVDDKGMTLYLYTKDSPNTSNCYDQCAVAWPPFLTDGAPQAGTGVTATLLGTTTRKDGKMQVTYNGNPLYYYAKDKAPGDVTGQKVGGVWFVLSPRGTSMQNGVGTPVVPPGGGTGAAAPTQQAPTAAASLKVSQNDTLGQFLVDDKGMTLYLYTKDAPNTSNCYDQCAISWPPLLTKGAAVGAQGIDASLLGTTTRKDGSSQVTYNGWPLYYWFRDKQPGDTSGQWVGSVWFVISPDGKMVTAGKPAPAATPAPTQAPAAPAAGGGGYGYNSGGGSEG